MGEIKLPDHLVFGLDIGTRSIVGSVGYMDGKKFNVAGHYVKEHDTRAMMDGQIHDIAKVGETINYVKRELNLAIGETTAEQIKKQLGCAMPLMTEMSMEVKGRDLSDGLPRTVIITSSQVEEALKESIAKIVEIIKITLEKAPPELPSDIMEKGIMLSGGGALIQNLDKLISLETGMPVYIVEEPLDCVVKGTEKTLQDIEKLRTILLNSRKRR